MIRASEYNEYKRRTPARYGVLSLDSVQPDADVNTIQPVKIVASNSNFLAGNSGSIDENAGDRVKKGRSLQAGWDQV